MGTDRRLLWLAAALGASLAVCAGMAARPRSAPLLVSEQLARDARTPVVVLPMPAGTVPRPPDAHEDWHAEWMEQMEELPRACATPFATATACDGEICAVVVRWPKTTGLLDTAWEVAGAPLATLRFSAVMVVPGMDAECQAAYTEQRSTTRPVFSGLVPQSGWPAHELRCEARVSLSASDIPREAGAVALCQALVDAAWPGAPRF